MKYVLLLFILWAISTVLMHCTGRGKIHKVIRGFAYIGVVFHEACHLLIAWLVHAKVEEVRVGRSEENIFGYVKVDNDDLNFLQAVLIGIAPFIISVLVFTSILLYLYSPLFDIYIGALLVLLSLSLIIGSVPSFDDWGVMANTLRWSPGFAIYQICIVLAGIYTEQMFFPEISIFFWFEPLNSFAFLFVFYYFSRYFFKGLVVIYNYTTKKLSYYKTDRRLNRLKRKNFKHKPIKGLFENNFPII